MQTQVRRVFYRMCGVGLCFGLMVNPGATDEKDAHAIAERFAGAHETKTTKATPPATTQNEIQPEHVEGAFEIRKQESDLKRNEHIIESVSARTDAIEELLSRTENGSWHGKVVPTQDAATETIEHETTTGATLSTAPLVPPANVMRPDLPGEIAIDAGLQDKNPEVRAEKEAAAPQEDVRDVTDLPQPAYALGGTVDVRRGVSEEASELLTTATILLLIEPGNKGIRRFKKTADPVLCGRRHCYMSEGTSKKARRMHRGATLGPFNTLGQRAGACRQKLDCAFRDLDLMADGVLMQPVDLKFMRHDRRAYRSFKPDTSCAMSAGRLHCRDPIIAKTWKAWVVPEALARTVGDEALTMALEEGLPDQPIPTVQLSRSKTQ